MGLDAQKEKTMKKMIFAVLVVLLAMLAVTCDSAVLPAKLAAGPDEATPPPGEEDWVTLNIGLDTSSDRSRAMDVAQAVLPENTNYIEVVFLRSGGTTIRKGATFNPTTNIIGTSGMQITVQAGNYDNITDKAVLLAGNVSEGVYTLTAVGNITTTSTGGTTITKTPTATTTVTFSLTAVKSAVNTTLEITSPGDGTVLTPTNINVTVSPTSTHYPVVFQVLTASTTYTAKYTPTVPHVGVLDLTTALNNTADVTSPGGVTGATAASIGITSVPFASQTVTIGGVSPSSVPTIVADPYASDHRLDKATLDFTFTTPNTGSEGLSTIIINVPVYGINKIAGLEDYNTTTTGPLRAWRLRGGMDNTIIDKGSTGSTPADRKGGAILLSIEDTSVPPAALDDVQVNVGTTPVGSSPVTID